MLAIAGPGREASGKSNLGFIEGAAQPSAGLEFIEAAAQPCAGCQCLCLPDGPTEHQVLSWLFSALSNGPCTSSCQIFATRTRTPGNPKPGLPSTAFWVSTVSLPTKLGLIRLGRAQAGRHLQDGWQSKQTLRHRLRSASQKFDCA